MERETGLEPATFSLEGLNLPAVWRPSWTAVHFVSSYRVVIEAICPIRATEFLGKQPSDRLAWHRSVPCSEVAPCRFRFWRPRA